MGSTKDWLKDMFANVRNLVGGRSAAVEDTMRVSRETVLLELKREAHAKGANAVIALDVDYTQLSSGGNMMVLVSASGTAVVIEE
ncbi:YbjQ family protein [Planktomarina sp.]|nr:YbjQ family protein [Planktomarina sp.]